jgi:hypothetical protein
MGDFREGYLINVAPNQVNLQCEIRVFIEKKEEYLEIPEPLITSCRNCRQFVPQHFGYLISFFISLIFFITQIGAMHSTKSPGQAIWNIHS